jgi:hypothetical protein
VKLNDVSTKELMRELTGRHDIRDETYQMLVWDMADLGRPKWQDKVKNPERLSPELRNATAPTFLKIAWADEIDSKGRIRKLRVRYYDQHLMNAVERYTNNRRNSEDKLDANGLVLLTGKEPIKARPRPVENRRLSGCNTKVFGNM